MRVILEDLMNSLTAVINIIALMLKSKGYTRRKGLNVGNNINNISNKNIDNNSKKKQL